MPFDRLVRAVDAWAGRSGRTDVFAQIGASALRPANLEWTRFLDPPEFRRRVQAADAVVAHAGMGSILTALELGVPILVLPRRGALRETRNDHQVATAERLSAMGRVDVAFDDDELALRLERIDELGPRERIASRASDELLAAVRALVEEAPARGR